MTGHVLLCNRQGLGNDWGVSIIQQSGITPGDLAPHPFVSLESPVSWLALESDCGQLASTCMWPVGRHLHVASWPQVIWVGKWFSYIYEWPVLKVPTLN